MEHQKENQGISRVSQDAMKQKEHPILKIEEISKTFARKNVLRKISLEVKKGEILGIIGASGSGKTTLLNTIIGFIEPEHGKIKFRVKTSSKEYKYITLSNKTKKIINNTYGFASQIPSFYEKLTVKENLEYFGELYGLGKETIKSNTETLIKLMSLENSSNVLAKRLSGGMERRLNIACAMIHNPDILILDEPTADLDPVMRNNIWNLIEKINLRGTTIILSSHHLNELENLCNRISIIKEGKILETASAKELIQRFKGDEDIKIQTYPGNYEKLGNLLIKQYPDIKKFINNGQELTLKCTNPHILLKELMRTIEENNEKIIELRLAQPSLDDIFLTINEIHLE